MSPQINGNGDAHFFAQFEDLKRNVWTLATAGQNLSAGSDYVANVGEHFVHHHRDHRWLAIRRVTFGGPLDAFVLVSVLINPGTSAGIVALLLDGTAFYADVLALSGADFASVAAPVQLSGVTAAVAPAVHAFTFQYSSTGGIVGVVRFRHFGG